MRSCLAWPSLWGGAGRSPDEACEPPAGSQARVCRRISREAGWQTSLTCGRARLGSSHRSRAAGESRDVRSSLEESLPEPKETGAVWLFRARRLEARIGLRLRGRWLAQLCGVVVLTRARRQRPSLAKRRRERGASEEWGGVQGSQCRDWIRLGRQVGVSLAMAMTGPPREGSSTKTTRPPSVVRTTERSGASPERRCR